MSYRKRSTCLVAAALIATMALWPAKGQAADQDQRCARDWRAGPSGKLFADRFPIGVWLQAPKLADRYHAIGVNLYIGLWKGPTAEQLITLRRANMPVIGQPTGAAQDPANADVVAGWLLPDEPDNAQRLPIGVGYGPPIDPSEVASLYCKAGAINPPRPVLLQLGMGVAWDQWRGRGVRTGHMEDYPDYVRSSDIVSFDIYPVTSTIEGVTGRIDLIGVGMDRLMNWKAPDQLAWATIGLTRIGNPDRKPTPQEIQSQIWTAIVHGARGLIFFMHQFKPDFDAAAIFSDPAGMAAVSSENARIQSLAPVLLRGIERPETASIEGNAHLLALSHGGKRYVLAVSGQASPLLTTLRFHDTPTAVYELFEEKRVPLAAGKIRVPFPPFAPRIFVYEE